MSTSPGTCARRSVSRWLQIASVNGGGSPVTLLRAVRGVPAFGGALFLATRRALEETREIAVEPFGSTLSATERIGLA
jgi:hypothetical protein